MKKYLPLILIALAIGIFFVFIDPQYEKIQELRKQKRDNDNMLELSRELQRKRDNLQSSYNNIGIEDRRDLEKLLPDTVDNVRLILDISNVAEQYGILIQNIEISKDDNPAESKTNIATSVDRTTDIGTIRLGFTVAASYEIFMTFMKDLEETLRIVDIRSLNIRQGQESFMTYEVIIDTYWLR
jgi:Tfp pilus assembly protein PilO